MARLQADADKTRWLAVTDSFGFGGHNATLVIKRYFIDSDKIHAQIQENKLKEPKKQSKFQRKLQEVMEQAEAEKAKKAKK